MLRTLSRYGLAVVTVAVALLITSSLESYTDITPLFYAAIVVSAWFGGMGPGLLAVVLATVDRLLFCRAAVHAAPWTKANQLSDGLRVFSCTNELDEQQTPAS